LSINYLKRAHKTTSTEADAVRQQVKSMLDKIEEGGDQTALKYARDLDQWDGPIVVSQETIQAAESALSEQLRSDIHLAHRNVNRFANAQREAIQNVQIEVVPGLIAGQKQIPVHTAGCYVPGGRYSHIASAIMTVTTAKAAGVQHIIACSPPKPGIGMSPAMLYTLNLCGADSIINLGGVQGVAAMVFGLFGLPQADILVGPGNQFVAEAKRVLFGRVGIDMLAGPTEILIIADASADPEMVTRDLIGQAEHGYNSPVWLIALDRRLAEQVVELAPQLAGELPGVNGESAQAAWADFAEVAVVDERQEAVALADEYAAEHLHVQCADLDWWLAKLRNYGSLFLGEETTVAFGDKVSGPNHVLPTNGAARYTGGLSVGKFLKTVTWQRMTQEANRQIAPACARISRLEGMEGHARTADVRLEKWLPHEDFNLSAD
jgi:sulfopropanediol 3-dehydrogenase